MAAVPIKLTTTGPGGISIVDAFILRDSVVLTTNGNAYVSVKVYKDQASYDSKPDEPICSATHQALDSDLTTLLAAHATNSFEKKADDFLKATPYSGAVDY